MHFKMIISCSHVSYEMFKKFNQLGVDERYRLKMVDMWLLHGHISGKLERKLGLKICDKITTFHIEQKLATEFVIEMHVIFLR